MAEKNLPEKYLLSADINMDADPSKIASAIRKMHEDPLFVIKREEQKHQKSLVDNPLVRERVRQMMLAERAKEAREKERAAINERSPKREYRDSEFRDSRRSDKEYRKGDDAREIRHPDSRNDPRGYRRDDGRTSEFSRRSRRYSRSRSPPISRNRR